MKKELTFEAAAAQLDDILAQLSAEETPLDQALQLYARAAQLISFCTDALQNAQLQIDEIDAKFTLPEQ